MAEAGEDGWETIVAEVSQEITSEVRRHHASQSRPCRLSFSPYMIQPSQEPLRRAAPATPLAAPTVAPAAHMSRPRAPRLYNSSLPDPLFRSPAPQGDKIGEDPFSEGDSATFRRNFRDFWDRLARRPAPSPLPRVPRGPGPPPSAAPLTVGCANPPCPCPSAQVREADSADALEAVASTATNFLVALGG